MSRFMSRAVSAGVLLPIIFLCACSNSSTMTLEKNWEQAYNAGLAAQEANDLDGAETHYRHALVILRPKKNSYELLRAKTQISLATVLLAKHQCNEAMMKSMFAMRFYEKRWDPTKAASSLDDRGRDYLNATLLHGRTLNCMGLYSQALPFLEKTRSLQKNVIVPVKFNHELTDALREALRATGQKDAAVELAWESKSTASSVANADLKDIEKMTYQQALEEGKSAHLGGNFHAAEKLLKHAVQKGSECGSDSMQLAAALLKLGDLYCAKQRYVEAKPLLERALAIARIKLDTNSRRLKEYINRMASYYANIGDWKKAAALDEEALELIFEKDIRREKQAHNSRDLMEALIGIYKNDKQYEKAEKMARRKLAIEENAYGKGSRKAGVTLAMLAEVLVLERKPKEADAMYRDALDALRKNGGTDPRELRTALESYVKFLDKKGDAAHARKINGELTALNAELVDDFVGR